MNYVCGYSPPLINVVRHKVIKKLAMPKMFCKLFFPIRVLLIHAVQN